MSNGDVPKVAFANINSKFNDAKARANKYAVQIQTHINNQRDWFPVIGNIPDQASTAKLNEMEELTTKLELIRDKFCVLEDMW
jgi:hypothetical protein